MSEVLNSVIALTQSNDKTMLEKIQAFTRLLNKEPDATAIDKTPDGKAKTVLISHIEMTLDELFFGQWTTENFNWQVVSNEIVGSIDLVVIHPVSGQHIRRTGGAAIQIMVDAAPESVKADPRLRNAHALDVGNKKPNALDMGFPKLKAECLKNAAQSLGKVFGRDLNRKEGKFDTYNPLIKKDVLQQLPEAQIQEIMDLIDKDQLMEVEQILQIPFDEQQKKLINDKLTQAKLKL